MKFLNYRRQLLAAVALAFTTASAWAGGLTMYEVGTPDTGYASAGYAARADDPGTVLTNPAGMTRLQGSQVLVGGHLLYGNLNFSHDGDTTVPGNDGGNAIGLLPGLSAFGTYQVNNDLTLGMGIFSNFGLGLWYSSDWAGRYYAKDAVLMGFSLLPAAAYRVNDQLSLGVGLNVMIGYLYNTIGINNVDPGWPDGQLKLKDTTVGVGANVGVLYEPTKGTRLGATYNSPVKLDFSSTPEFTTTGPGLTSILVNRGTYYSKIDMGITVPQGVMASFYQDLNDRWALLGNFGWQQWSQFGKIDVSVDRINTIGMTTNLNFKDTWHGALGAQYRLSDPWLLNGGVAYDSSMLDKSNRSPSLPVAWAWRFALGSQYDLRKDLKLGLAYEYLYGGDIPLDVSRSPLAGTVSGYYRNMSIQCLNASLNWKF
jgi:long-chain fatty acid transport protein